MVFFRLRSAFSFSHSLAFIVLTILASDSFAQTTEGSDGAALLVGREDVSLPPFSEISERPLIDLYANESDYEQARSDASFRLERLTYLSDGFEVVAYLYRPDSTHTPQQTIVFNRGSYVRDDAAPEYLTMFHRLGRAGFVVLSPMYRGSEGADGRDEMGGDDLNDLMRTAQLADELPSIDAGRLFLLGESRGGMMVLQAIRDEYPARAAATYGSPTDFFRLLKENPEQYEAIADQVWPDWRSRTDEIIGRRSAVNWVDRIDVPLLIMHGADDRSMPVSQSLDLVTKLQALGKIYELHIFGYQNHMISGKSAERDALAMAWFERHSND